MLTGSTGTVHGEPFTLSDPQVSHNINVTSPLLVLTRTLPHGLCAKNYISSLVHKQACTTCKELGMHRLQ